MDDAIRLGEICSVEDLENGRGRELASLVESSRIYFSELVEVRRDSASEFVIIRVDVEIPQVRAADIVRFETLAIRFSRSADTQPEVLALRPDFPPRLPHTNLRPRGYPPSICYSEDKWSDLLIWWTPSRFVELLRQWLARTARGELHGNDQSLEPLIMAGAYLLLPAALIDEVDDGGPTALDGFCIKYPSAQLPIYVTYRSDDPNQPLAPEGASGLSAFAFRCPPQTHGVIAHEPHTLSDLVEFFEPTGLDLVAILSNEIREWRTDSEVLKRQLLLVSIIPKRRTKDAAPESRDVYGFIIKQSIRELGESLGLWEEHDGKLGVLLSGVPDPGSVELGCVLPVAGLSPDRVARMAGLSQYDDRRVVSIGAGALGSQATTTLLQCGYGAWTLVDDDVLFPHNQVRHSLLGPIAGVLKAEYLALHLNATIPGLACDSIVCDVLSPRENEARLSAALSGADDVFDFSASTPVLRFLSRNAEVGGRCACAFLNPGGDFAVLLSEDSQRETRLDSLESVLMRELLGNVEFADFFSAPGGFRYGIRCSDVSSVMPQDRVGLHAALISRAIRSRGNDAALHVWRADADGGVRHWSIDAPKVLEFSGSEWVAEIDEALVRGMAELRRERLPAETGGVLVGSVDAERRRISIVDFLPAPVDSVEHPTHFIRGQRGMAAKVEEIAARTASGVYYVGEWHSHPEGSGVQPSEDDEKLARWIGETMSVEGLPGLMLILSGSEVSLSLCDPKELEILRNQDAI